MKKQLNRFLRLSVFALFSVLSLSKTVLAQSGEKIWVVSGYLPNNPTQKVYVTVRGKKIETVSAQQPTGLASMVYFNTEDYIFPGITDMHNHIKYNVLPLWDRALGQFKNRFEWRNKYSPYKLAVSANMKALDTPDSICAATRYAELKSLLGGSTAIQGVGNEGKCAKGFATLNLEIEGELESPDKVRAATDLISPEMMGSVFEPFIAGYMRNEKLTYEESYFKMLSDKGVTEWVNFFTSQPATINNALKLLLGLQTTVQLPATVTNKAQFVASYTALKQSVLTQKLVKDVKAADKLLADMTIWIFGKLKPTEGYLATERTPKKAEDFITKGGVLSVDSKIRRYIGMFEGPRSSAAAYLAKPGALAVVAHLAEGQPNDTYNRTEYQYTRTLGLARKGLVAIHAVGMNAADFADAAQRQVAVVWSPFSNLLLYGETLDIVAAKNAKMLIALGADWTPTGSKNMLDELKIARRYLNYKGVSANVISDKDLVTMAIANPAAALNRQGVIGSLSPGALANLLVVKKKSSMDAYSSLVASDQKDISLVSVAGDPLYGEVAHINQASKAWDKGAAPEVLPRSPVCGFKKGLRLVGSSPYDVELKGKGISMRTEGAITKMLTAKIAAAGNKFKLDPLFKCEDAVYSKRFAEFLPTRVAENTKMRMKIRAGGKQIPYPAGVVMDHPKMDESWSPLKGAPEGEGEGAI